MSHGNHEVAGRDPEEMNSFVKEMVNSAKPHVALDKTHTDLTCATKPNRRVSALRNYASKHKQQADKSSAMLEHCEREKKQLRALFESVRQNYNTLLAEDSKKTDRISKLEDEVSRLKSELSKLRATAILTTSSTICLPLRPADPQKLSQAPVAQTGTFSMALTDPSAPRYALPLPACRSAAHSASNNVASLAAARKLVSKLCWNHHDVCDGQFPCENCTSTGRDCEYKRCHYYKNRKGRTCQRMKCFIIHNEMGCGFDDDILREAAHKISSRVGGNFLERGARTVSPRAGPKDMDDYDDMEMELCLA
ncbi:hypothetical protein BU16DRAFT_566333 [Lophium mytilinum]|uniref:Uncharacterized protein n=1 Tax=Lophium mytilinum TaxID=390894 RepID=A0A6A6QDT3_9PEZI|nr:hypothetical protein BU16DRAFT_566333 [Lophium mytilinum]